MDSVIRIVITLSEHTCGLWTLLYELLAHQVSTLVAYGLRYTNYHINWTHLCLMDSVMHIVITSSEHPCGLWTLLYNLWLVDSVIGIVITSSEHTCGLWTLLYKLSHRVSTVVAYGLCYAKYHIKWAHMWLVDSVIQIITSSEHNKLCFVVSVNKIVSWHNYGLLQTKS